MDCIKQVQCILALLSKLDKGEEFVTKKWLLVFSDKLVTLVTLTKCHT